MTTTQNENSINTAKLQDWLTQAGIAEQKHAAVINAIFKQDLASLRLALIGKKVPAYFIAGWPAVATALLFGDDNLARECLYKKADPDARFAWSNRDSALSIAVERNNENAIGMIVAALETKYQGQPDKLFAALTMPENDYYQNNDFLYKKRGLSPENASIIKRSLHRLIIEHDLTKTSDQFDISGYNINRVWQDVKNISQPQQVDDDDGLKRLARRMHHAEQRVAGPMIPDTRLREIEEQALNLAEAALRARQKLEPRATRFDQPRNSPNNWSQSLNSQDSTAQPSVLGA